MSYQRFVEAMLTGEPYFGPVLRALQGPVNRHRYFLPTLGAAAELRGPFQILEVGSWAGASAISWAWAMRKLELSGRVLCVDPWRPYFDLEKNRADVYAEMNRGAEKDLIYKLFEHNVTTSGFGELIDVIRGESKIVLPGLESERFHLVYVDGSHAFEDVQSDLQEAKRLVRDGGIICGDDLELQACEINAEELDAAVRTGQDFIESSSGPSYHPGVTAAVKLAFGEVTVMDGFWAARRCGRDWMPIVVDSRGSELPDHLAPAILERVAETDSYHFVAQSGRYYAMAKELVPPPLVEQLLGNWDLPPLLFTGCSADEVRRKADEAQRRPSTGGPSHNAAYHPTAKLIGSHCGFNLAKYGLKTYGLHEGLGPVDLREGDAALLAKYSPEDVIIGESADVVRARIDIILLRRELHSVAETVRSLTDTVRPALSDATSMDSGEYRGFKLIHSNGCFYAIRSSVARFDANAESSSLAGYDAADLVVGSSVDDVRSRIDMIAAMQQNQAETAALRSALTTLTDHLERSLEQFRQRIMEDQASRWTAEIEELRTEAAHRFSVIEDRLEGQRSEAAAAETELRRHVNDAIQQVQTTVQERLIALSNCVEELRAAAAHVQEDLIMLAERKFDFGCSPEGKPVPRLVEIYRGFRIFGAGHQLYAVRDGYGEPETVMHLIAEGQLGSQCDGDNVILGFSLDGVRARIDALHAEIAVRELTGRLIALSGGTLELDLRPSVTIDQGLLDFAAGHANNSEISSSRP